MQLAEPGERFFTREELRVRDGKHGQGLCIAVLGEVYDVTAGLRHYGPHKSYSMLTGRDASKSLATGNFVDDLHDDIHDFTDARLKAVLKWRKFYRNSKARVWIGKYHLVGRVMGAFYDGDGEPTPLLLRIEALDAGAKPGPQPGEASVDLQPCNSRWTTELGTEVWCEAGVPRKLVVPGGNGALHPTCVCQRGEGVSRGRRLFGNCPPASTRCPAPEMDEGDDDSF